MERETRRPREGQSNTDEGETERQKTNAKTDGGLGARWRQKRAEEQLKVSALEKPLRRR